MRTRPSSRLIVLDPRDRVLLFRFVFEQGPLAGHDYWATPGGGLEAGETFRCAAKRELKEENRLRNRRRRSRNRTTAIRAADSER